ncbi:MAG: hypothetical protein ICV77_03375 [Cyanobacteria bacterium Co-bin8]|nr:hypothetical protein [Cyanobacteria bacterium Co-bin8]
MTLHNRQPSQSNDWNAARLANHGHQLEAAYSLGLTQSSAKESAEGWTEKSLVNLGRSLASAYLLGL